MARNMTPGARAQRRWRERQTRIHEGYTGAGPIANTWIKPGDAMGVFAEAKARGGSFEGVQRKSVARRIWDLLASLVKRK